MPQNNGNYMIGPIYWNILSFGPCTITNYEGSTRCLLHLKTGWQTTSNIKPFYTNELGCILHLTSNLVSSKTGLHTTSNIKPSRVMNITRQVTCCQIRPPSGYIVWAHILKCPVRFPPPPLPRSLLFKRPT